MPLRKNKGFTLVELLVAAYILLVGICGILSLFVNTLTSSESSWDTTTATSHAQYVLEEMQTKLNLSEIRLTNWKKWVGDTGLLTLPDENITITFGDPTSDPLDIQVVDQWQRKKRLNTVTLRTKLTK